MNIFQSTLLTAATVAIASSTLAVVDSNEAKALNVDQAHISLANAIRSTGVKLKINPNECFTRRSMGWYHSTKGELAVCQQHGISANNETYWTAEDLDTLRHEAQHLIQDCMDSRPNGKLSSVYKDPYGLAKSIIGNDAINNISRVYGSKGSHIVMLEIEAFTVAAMNIPDDQINDINKYCF